MNRPLPPDLTGLTGLLNRQRQAFRHDGPPPLERRRAALKRLRDAVVARQEDIATAISADFGHRSRHETLVMELLTLVRGIDYLHANLRRFMRPERRHVDLVMRPGSARIEYQPLGVIGIMSPWNYPFSLAVMPLATAIAAGNRAMIKPSEFTPATSALLADLLAGLFPEDQVAVVQGDATVGMAFSSLGFDHLVFTGSTAVGRAVMRAASDHLVPVTLELGGKSPAIVGLRADINHSAASIAFGKLANAGQTCIAPDYALVPEGALDAFIAAYDRSVRKLYPDGPGSADYTSIIGERHHARLTGLLDDARVKGARVIEAGCRNGALPAREHALAPVVVVDVTDDMKIMQEEIFGPLLPIRTVRSIGEAIDIVNAQPRPLALYYFGPDDADRQAVLARTVSGNVTLNGTLTHYAQEDLPFGGVGPSGMGAYHGIEGFRSLSHARGIFEQGRPNGASLLQPPFGRLADRLLRFLLR